jgi:hypothetical protein
MAEEVSPNPPTAISKINKLKNEIKGLKGKFEEVEKKIHRGTTESKRRWYILVKGRRSKTWEEYGVFENESDVRRTIGELKNEITKRHSRFSEYYVTESDSTMRKFLQSQKYKEKKYHQEMEKEITELPRSRYIENIKTGVKIEEPKTVSREIEKFSGYTGKTGLPRMAVSTWGSQLPPRKSNVPSFGAIENTKPRKQKLILLHEEYQSYLDSGYTKKQLSELGIFSKRSEFYRDTSPFPNAVAYRPISYYQSFVHINPPQTEYQKRIAEGRPYEPFRPKKVFL